MSRASEIRVGMGSCGVASGATPVLNALLEAGAADIVKAVGCNGMCHREPMVEVIDTNGRSTMYGNVTPEAARQIARKYATWIPVRDARIREFEMDLESGSAARYLAKQRRIVLENCGQIDPQNIDDYIEREGYQALMRVRETLSPEEVIAAIEAAGLRGRGGAGFPSARKWTIARGQPGRMKYVICNGDEGDPGAFMDRLVLESDPHRVVEGLAIAAYAIGAPEGFFYIRAEYPLAVRRIRHALEQAAERGYLDGVHFEVREGAGAFVCGEETALILSLEGQRGMPKLRPPYPAESGLHGRPTVINNVETLACVPWILRRGPEAFAALGTATSKGTKVFALAGKIRYGGLIEVPMGITIREIVEDIGGGVKDGRKFKGVQIGGPSGGCIPERLADTPIDYDALASTGAIMGSGGLVVLDDRDCMVDMARFFLQFTQAESCGKCTFCRIGVKRMLEILNRLCEGKAKPDDMQKLETLADYVSRGSLCGLGQTAPNPVVTTLRYFRDEYEAHFKDHRCPAGRCTALIEYRVNDNCIGCTLCAQACPVGAIASRPYQKHEIDVRLCTRCDMCFQACKDSAIEVI